MILETREGQAPGGLHLGLSAAALRRLASPPREPSPGPTDQFTLLRLRARSCHFGAIHLQPLPCDRAGTVSILRRGAPWGSRRGGAYQEVTLIRPFGPPYPFCPSGTFPPDRGNRPSPLEGEGLRAADSRPYKGNRNLIPHPSRATARVAPTAYPAPGVLVRQSQAQNWNRTNCNFCKPRAQWPGRNLDCHSDFARRKVSVWPKG